MSFRTLLSPGRIGDVVLDNRVILPAMDMNLCEDGHFSDAEVAHYTARAAGGTAMIITGTGAVAWPQGGCSWHQPAFSDDKYLPTMTRLVESIHAAGSKLCFQLCHHGKTAGVDTAEERPLLVPTAPVPAFALDSLQDNTMDELMKLGTAARGKKATYKEATEDDLMWVIDQFADAAERCVKSGVDAVEIHAAHGYLINTFLSAGYNRRTDRWGGSIENRARLMVEVVSAVRRRVGDALAISVRLNGMEFGLENGMTPTECAEFAVLAERAGADAIHVSANAHNPFADFTDGPLPSAVGKYRDYAKLVKSRVSIPVIAVGRLLPELAEAMLKAGECDFVSMGRQLLADPELVKKIREGERSSVRPCINCYVCVEQNFFDSAPKCAVNPALCNESIATVPVAPRAKTVAVIGGGPAGMEAARVAALRGHSVTLYEKAARLGGTAWFSQLTTPANGPLIDWLEHEVRRLGVQVNCSTALSADDIAALGADEVVVATGAVRRRPDDAHLTYPGSRVYTGDDLRALLTGDGDVADAPRVARLAASLGRAVGIMRRPDRIRTFSKIFLPLSKKVTVVGGGLVGLELAEFLAERGRRVTLVEEGAQLGLPMAMPRRWTAVRRAAQHGVELRRNSSDAVVNRDVIIANNVSAEAPIADVLRERGVNTHTVGDAAHVGYIEGAIHSGHAVAREL